MTDWAVIDVSNLCWWIYYSTGRRDPGPSAIGFLTGIPKFCKLVGCDSVVFACDCPPYKRSADLPGYKSHRTKSGAEDSDNEDILRGYIRQCPDYLRLLGYKNILSQRGYEADDLMAAAALAIPPGDRAVLVSGDQDLYQCLSSRVAVYHPRSPGAWVTAAWFKTNYGIKPHQWVEVKCLAGCNTDRIGGLDGVAELTALKFFRGELADTATRRRCLEFNRSPEYARNRKMIALPYPGLDPVALIPDGPDPTNGYKPLAERFGVDIDDPVMARRLTRSVSIED